MNNWAEPRFLITLLLIGLFGYAYIIDPGDEAMKGALIGAFSAAYGFWIGSKQNDKAVENTGKAFDAIQAASAAPSTTPQPVEVVNTPSHPIPTTDSAEETLPDYARP